MTIMRLFKFICGLLAVIIASFSLSSCGENHMDAFIYVEFENTASVLDPQLAKSAEELTVVRSIFDTLLRYDKNGNIVPSAAKSFEKKGNTYTFKLKENAKWVDGTEVTANDFVFGFSRGVDPENKAPYAATLSAIKGAEAIMKGEAELSSLGVHAADKHTLIIELQHNDPEFEKVLTTAITMPCNEKYFKACKGKYGLTLDTTPANGSYYVKEWFSETKFLIRLAKNLDYKGNFEANSMRIYFTCSENDALAMLEHDNTDLAYISVEEYADVSKSGFKIHSTQDTCYALLIKDTVDPDIRKALLSAVNSDTYKQSLLGKQSIAQSLYPEFLKVSNPPKVTEKIVYAPDDAAKLYSETILDGKTVEGITVKHPSDTVSTNVAKALAGHWQQKLSCFLNIEAASDAALQGAYESGFYDIIILPFSSPISTLDAYHSVVGFGDSDAATVAEAMYDNHLAYPLYFSNTNIAFGSKMQNSAECVQGGILDVSMLIKEQ